ncbi:hypothetical protein TRFO_06690 [Tritrichomonas foetus]|uniref:Uncharacterized protein n=1 Tax=Tritrichomonas foetus TaxID=1144522 RepID=A0A1J4K117_9EUKA|nr:hypothetical protein TRFO_06690 [Tritrichomonas foetus]|eukprot:OHT03446.1 hypothetical protein TRFO_06690 [Tritrichomonas foetus]
MSSSRSSKVKIQANKPARSKASNTPRSPIRISPSNSQQLTVKDVKEMEKIEKLYPDLAGKSLVQLRNMKKKSIDKFDYDKSKYIQAYIVLSEKDNTTRIINDYKEWLQGQISEAIANYETNLTEIEKETDDKELAVREDIQLMYENMKKRHIEEIMEVETLRQISILREQNREKFDVKTLKKQSQKMAATDDIDAARYYKNQADLLHEENIIKGVENVDLKFNKILDKLKQKQTFELSGLQNKLQDYLRDVDSLQEEQIHEQQKKLLVFINHNLQKAINDGAKVLIKKDMMATVNLELRSFVQQFLKDQNREYILEAQVSE